ncbi:MAG: metallophosphoesterase [bacterium]
MTENGEGQSRKIIAVGDLHGDFWRLMRLMEEQNLFIPSTRAWNPEVRNVDLVLVGDYVDWRGEPLEGSPASWQAGIRHLVFFIRRLWHEIERLKKLDPLFNSAFYPLMGNHDLMMLESLSLFPLLEKKDLELLMSNYRTPAFLRDYIGRSGALAEKIMKFLNWYSQGGNMTINSFGGLSAFQETMEGPLGDFLREKLRIGVVLNGRLYAHSIPDEKKFWRPLEELQALASHDLEKAREALVWGRRVWGFDVFTGTKSRLPSKAEIERLLAMMGVSGAVVGHTPINSPVPYLAYEGKLINVDLHGIPGSHAWVEEYQMQNPESKSQNPE